MKELPQNYLPSTKASFKSLFTLFKSLQYTLIIHNTSCIHFTGQSMSVSSWQCPAPCVINRYEHQSIDNLKNDKSEMMGS